MNGKMQQREWFTLPHELLESQLSMIDLLQAMFPDELTLDSTTTLLIEQLRYRQQDQKTLKSISPPLLLSLVLNISINEDVKELANKTIQLSIAVPLESEEPDPMEAPPLRMSIRRSNWLSKAQVSQLNADMPPSDVLSAIDYIRDEAPNYIRSAQPEVPELGGMINSGPIIRVWFYFPSLSTREKRDDLVNHAPSYSLTGFVLAGKPGVLCLEGSSKHVDAYMKFIKTESWSDIPSHQKKVSERYREEGVHVSRVFGGMEEITDSLGERRGERANRGDMKALEAWLTERGLGGVFEKVIML